MSNVEIIKETGGSISIRIVGTGIVWNGDIDEAAAIIKELQSAIGVENSTSTNKGMQADAQICQMIAEDTLNMLIREGYLKLINVPLLRDRLFNIVAGKLLHT